jgi:hypothetical protein
MFKEKIKKIEFYSEDKLADVLFAPRNPDGSRADISPSGDADADSTSSSTTSNNNSNINIENSGIDFDPKKINNIAVANIDQAISSYVHYYFKILMNAKNFLESEKYKAKNNQNYLNEIDDKIKNINLYMSSMRNLINNNDKKTIEYTYSKPSISIGFGLM